MGWLSRKIEISSEVTKKKGQTAKRLEKNDEKLLDPGCIERCEDSLDVLDDFHIFSYEKCGNPTTKIINVEKI